MLSFNDELNFNELAWKAPTHDGRVGYLPDDEFYWDILRWLITGEVLYESSHKNAYGELIVVKRIRFEDSPYDVIVETCVNNNRVMYTFRKQNTFSI